MKSLIVAIATLVPAVSVQAIQLPTNPSSQIVLNFDFASSAPHPPYSAIQFISNYISSDPTTITWTFYDGLNGTGNAETRSFPSAFYGYNYGNGPVIAFSTGIPWILDGKFSVGLYDTSGNASMANFVAQGQIYGSNFQKTQFITYPLSPVPEPSIVAMVLLGAGVLGLATRARRFN